MKYTSLTKEREMSHAWKCIGENWGYTLYICNSCGIPRIFSHQKGEPISDYVYPFCEMGVGQLHLPFEERSTK